MVAGATNDAPAAAEAEELEVVKWESEAVSNATGSNANTDNRR
jgi:hypothetical protein